MLKSTKPGFGRVAHTVMGILTSASVVFLILLAVTGKPAAIDLHNGGNGDPVASTKPLQKPAGGTVTGSPVPTLGDTPKVRVATWNMRDCAASDGSGKRVALHAEIAQLIKETQVDVIVAEEVQVDSKKGGDIALLSVALAQAGWSMPYVYSIDPPGEDDLAVFSKYPIRDTGEIATPQKGDTWPRAGIAATIDVQGKALHVFGFHFKAMGDSASEASRRAQALAICSALNDKYGPSLSKQAIVLAGDFNTTNPDEFTKKNSTLGILSFQNDTDPNNDFLDANYRYCPDKPTFVDSRYKSVLDHVLVSPTLARTIHKDDVLVVSPPKVEAPNASGGVPVSDHRMVAVDIALP